MKFCHILKDKRTGDEFLIPGCHSVANTFGSGISDMTDREIIKSYCSCYRPKREKYVTKTRDEVFCIIEKLQADILKMEDDLENMKEELSGLEAEVFMLNVTEEINP